jgi:hypothetical protein
MNGDIDEVFLLNGTALNQQQVQKLYNGLQGTVLSSVSSLTGDTNLKGYWKFDETTGTNVADSSGNAHDGTASATSILNNAYGKFSNKGVFVRASSNIVTLTDNADLKPTGNFTFGGWFRTTHAVPGDFCSIFASYNGVASEQGFNIGLTQTTPKIQFMIGRNTGSPNYKQLVGNTNVADGLWHHFACVWDGSNMYIYLDGNSDVTPFAFFAPVYNATNYVRIGGDANGGSNANYFDGDLDDMFLFNGTALSQSQIELLYRLTSGGVPGTPIDIDVTSSFLQGVKIIG